MHSTPTESLEADRPASPLSGDAAPAPMLRLTPAALSGWRSRIRVDHLGILLTLSYLFLGALGMLHEALVFLMFRVNILDFAEPSDFLVAALRDPLIVVVSLVRMSCF